MLVQSFAFHVLIVVKFDKAEQHHGEGPKGGAAIADKRQGDSDDGQHADGHADVDEEVDGENTGDAITIVSNKRISLFFREFQDSKNECAKKSEHH